MMLTTTSIMAMIIMMTTSIMPMMLLPNKHRINAE